MKKTKFNSVDQYIGSRMREGRLSLNMTQEQLAKALGVSFQQIQNYEKGVNGVSAVRLFDICKILNVSLSSMFPPVAKPLADPLTAHQRRIMKSSDPQLIGASINSARGSSRGSTTSSISSTGSRPRPEMATKDGLPII
jgi:transcriptional regulator with XRE-family HTH domain